MQGVWGDTIGELVALNEEMARRADAFIALPGACSRNNILRSVNF